jgi:hypothetical protein
MPIFINGKRVRKRNATGKYDLWVRKLASEVKALQEGGVAGIREITAALTAKGYLSSQGSALCVGTVRTMMRRAGALGLAARPRTLSEVAGTRGHLSPQLVNSARTRARNAHSSYEQPREDRERTPDTKA